MTRRVERIDFCPGSREEQIEKFCESILSDTNGRQVWLGLDSKGNIIAQLVSRYAIGEEVAVAQSYKTLIEQGYLCRESDGWVSEEYVTSPGYSNKMFVKASWMPHRIKITGIKLERLQDISEEDIYKEGFEKQSVNNGWGNAAWHWETMLTYMDDLGLYKEIRSTNPQEAFACLIDKLSGYGTWERNPWVPVYEFELMK